MAGGKYDVMPLDGHGLYPPNKVQLQEGWHDLMCMTSKGTYTCLSYNTNNCDNTIWNQYGGTGMTINVDMRSRMGSKGADPTKLGR